MRIATILCFLSAATLRADVSLPSVLGSHMVLQRDMPVPVWGKASPGEKVTVVFGGQTKTADASSAGLWSVKLDPMSANAQPQNMVVEGRNRMELQDILIGEVWLGSGQSNMQWSVKASQNPAAEIAAANFPALRLFNVPLVSSPVPVDDVKAAWSASTPQSIPEFSAVLFFMGRELHRELNVPVGLINSSWGGSRIEPWTPIEGFQLVASQRDNARTVSQNTPGRPEYNVAQQGYVRRVAAWAAEAQELAKSGKPLPPLPEKAAGLAHGHQQLVGTYNAMIHPLVPFALRGAVWYQGESNNGEGMLYADRKQALVGGWRAVWNQGDFPFYWVQLAPYNYTRKGPDPDRQTTALAEIWEAQSEAVKLIPNTGMAVINDVGDVNDIHPRNKQEAGRRLALIALAKNYGRAGIVYSGPVYREHAVDGNKVRIKFDHTGSGLASRDGQPLTWWEVAGADGKFVEAQAAIEGADVIVSSPGVPEPKSVRFAWSQLGVPNLMNREGLPAGAFRTR